MMYYILLPDDTEEGVQYSTNVLGESSFKNFWADQGYEILERLVNKYPDTINEIKIKDEKNKTYTPSEFLDVVEKLNIIR
tara:strand:+ start:4814 stop:5053 length:240 start_codon:yes stop_codon:yes gene_type:complete